MPVPLVVPAEERIRLPLDAIGRDPLGEPGELGQSVFLTSVRSSIALSTA